MSEHVASAPTAECGVEPQFHWDRRPGELEATRIEGEAVAVGHRDQQRGWLVRIIVKGETIDLPQAGAADLIEQIQMVLDAFAGRFGN